MAAREEELISLNVCFHRTHFHAMPSTTMKSSRVFMLKCLTLVCLPLMGFLNCWKMVLISLHFMLLLSLFILSLGNDEDMIVNILWMHTHLGADCKRFLYHFKCLNKQKEREKGKTFMKWKNHIIKGDLISFQLWANGKTKIKSWIAFLLIFVRHLF